MKEETEDSIGLIAGRGKLPIVIAKKLLELNKSLLVITFDKESFDQFKSVTDNVHQINLLEVEMSINLLKSNSIKKVLFAGKVEKQELHLNKNLDHSALKILSNLKDQSDDSIMLGIINELEQVGIMTIPQEPLILDLLLPAKLYTSRKLSADEVDSIRYGMKIAKELARLDIGQTVVVKDKSVMALEAIEGSDKAILRGGKLGNGNVIICKVAKPSQDKRFDIPTIGLDTVNSAISAGGVVIAIEANTTIVLDQASLISKCDLHNISLVAVNIDNENVVSI